MDRLPVVLQNEIWEYVRGDRAYWKQKFVPLLMVIREFKGHRMQIKWTPQRAVFNCFGHEIVLEWFPGDRKWTVRYDGFLRAYCEDDELDQAMATFVDECNETLKKQHRRAHPYFGYLSDSDLSCWDDHDTNFDP
jgi:hypothetical protein